MDEIGDTEDDGCYINNGELTCVITHNNLLALINNHWGDFEIEGDYILHWDNEYEDYQLNWEKQSTHRYEKKENGVLYHHKSLFVPNHETGWCLMYPLSILPLLKGVSCTPTMADIEIYGAERASYCHRITNYSEIPEWIEANQELGYFKAS